MSPSNTPVLAECWFLDVGQGLSNVILLGEGRAIVIDCGPRGTSVPLQLLKRHVHTIEALILSHNDADHVGGAARIIETYPRAIKAIHFLTDRPANYQAVFRLLQHEKAAGHLVCEPDRLEAKAKPTIIYKSPSAGVELKLLYPTYMESLEAEAQGSRRPNVTCGILALFCGKRSIVFSGDGTMEAWDAIASRLCESLPLRCEIMTVPHHGGHLTPQTSDESNEAYEARERRAIGRLYSEIICPRYAVVSVGSSNRFRNVVHPVPSTMAILRGLNIVIVCTQMTPHCAEDLESVRPGLLSPIAPSRSAPEPRKTSSGRSKDVACAGSIVAEVAPDRVTISRWQEHQEAVREATALGTIHPLCHVE